VREMLRAEKHESAALASKLETKEAELKWLQHKYFTTKALHVQELEVVAQRMLLLQASASCRAQHILLLQASPAQLTVLTCVKC